jgi:hypothetical protein
LLKNAGRNITFQLVIQTACRQQTDKATWKKHSKQFAPSSKILKQMLDAKQKLATAQTDAEAVYELYGLTEEEIRMVEGK